VKLSLMGRAFLAGTAVALALTACGGGGGGSETDTAATSGGKLEKTDITVGALPIPDVAPLQIGIQRGLFKEEGLNVKMQPVQSSVHAVPALQAGTIDVSLFNYTTAFVQEEKQPGQFKIIADSFQAAPNTFVVMVPPDSELKGLQDLKGKTVAVPGLKAVGQLLVEANLKTVGIDATRDGVKFVEMQFPVMPQALKTKQVDAAFMVEPFISASQKELGARKLADTITGPTADFPIAGWAATSDWIKKYPNTLAAFQRAMVKAQGIAAGDRKAVEQVLPTYTKIPPAVASVITLGTFPTSLNETRIQRVADIMLDLGYVKTKLTAKSVIAAPTSGT
jgi:NitT/TauT family transport system substrate-binding protein